MYPQALGNTKKKKWDDVCTSNWTYHFCQCGRSQGTKLVCPGFWWECPTRACPYWGLRRRPRTVFNRGDGTKRSVQCGKGNWPYCLESILSPFSPSLSRIKYLEDVERFKLDVTTLVLQKVHHQLEIVWTGNVSRHDRKIGPVQENLSEELWIETVQTDNSQHESIWFATCT
jgi:hypothetical protein